MLSRTYDNQICSIARTLELVGERWTLLIVRDALLGLRKFDEFCESLGIARNVLTDRLATLTGAGILERTRYQDHPPRYHYSPTEKGQELFPVLLALMHWGDRYLAGSAGPPQLTGHAGCGGEVSLLLECSACGPVDIREVAVAPGPGLPQQNPI